MRATGKVNFVGVLMLAALAGGVYWLMTFGMLYVDHYEVKEAVAVAYNKWLQVTPDRIRTELKNDLDSLKFGTHEEVDKGSGETRVKPGLGITDEQIVIEEDLVRKWVRVTVTYDRKVQLVPTQKTRVVRFVAEKKGHYAP
jgi:hypothetical protein